MGEIGKAYLTGKKCAEFTEYVDFLAPIKCFAVSLTAIGA